MAKMQDTVNTLSMALQSANGADHNCHGNQTEAPYMMASTTATQQAHETRTHASTRQEGTLAGTQRMDGMNADGKRDMSTLKKWAG